MQSHLVVASTFLKMCVNYFRDNCGQLLQRRISLVCIMALLFIGGSEWGGPFVGCRLKFSYFVGSRLKFSIFVGSRLNFLIFVGYPKISVNK